MSKNYKTYISYVVQKGESHRHDCTVIDFDSPKYNFYFDNESEQVTKWAEEQQRKLSQDEKLVVINFFHIANIK
jgi:hypothetical protein